MPLPLPYSLRLGVTGHRTLGDTPAVAAAVSRLLHQIDATLGHQAVAPLAWVAVSPLARGADRVVARAVVEERRGRLEVVTPFPLPDYRRDFETAGDRAEFEALLARASRVHQLGPSRVPPADTENTADEPRAAGYLRVGQRVVDACELLVAIWNGKPAAGPGGTGDIVAYALKQKRVVLWIHSDHPAQPARLIREVRWSTDGQLAADASVPFPDAAEMLSPGHRQQSGYCLDASLSAAVFERAVLGERAGLTSAATAASLPAGALEGVLNHVVPHYVRADQLAGHYQRRYGLARSGVLYIAATGVTAALLQVLFLPDYTRVVLIEIAAMVAVFGLWWWSRKKAWHEKWLRCRFLAERFRVATFAALVGGGPAQGKHDNPLPFYPGPQQWLVQAVDLVTQQALASAGDIPCASLKAFVVTQWLDVQHGYYAKKAEEKTHALHRRHQWGFALFGLTLLMATLHFLGVGHLPEEGHAQAWYASVGRLDLWITFLALALPVWAGAVHAVTAQLELDRIAARYRRMAAMLEPMMTRASAAEDIDELRQVCAEAAALMTAENQEWWVLLGFQGVQLHV